MLVEYSSIHLFGYSYYAMVFYRTYRPQTINELDSAEVREKLTAVLSSDHLSHAFLFTGPKGLGKTSTARIIAKAVNCERNRFAKGKPQSSTGKGKAKGSMPADFAKIEPCNECATCVSITNGINLDVIEIDAASNRGIDEIRELKEKINLAPIHAPKKVYIIDEVHMLTTEAFNALLKTLEEPPDHTIFILCTTEQHKVPATIISRCFHIAFRPASAEELVRSFKRIVASEKLQITEEALQTIASLAEGGFRDGTKLLEEMVSLSEGKEISKALVEEKLHIVGIETEVTQFVAYLANRNTVEGLTIIESLSKQKVDIHYFLQKVLEEIHGLLLKEVGVETRHSGSDSGQTKMTIVELQQLTELLAKAYVQMKTAFIPQLPLEVAIISWSLQKAQVLEDAIVNVQTTNTVGVTVDKQHNTVLTVKPEETTVSVASLRKHLGAIAKVKALYGEDAVKQLVPEAPIIETTSVSLLHFSPDGDITPEWLDVFWRNIINEMKKYNHTAAGVLRSCKIKEFDRKNLIIEAAYQFHKDRLSEHKTLNNLETICKGLLGSPVVVNVTLRSIS